MSPSLPLHRRHAGEGIPTAPSPAAESALPPAPDGGGALLSLSSLDAVVHHLIEDQARRRPDDVAVLYDGQTLTYRQLDERANQLAHHLQRLGVVPDGFVGLCLDRSLDLIVGLLAILKAGGAYLPLDPSYPAERLAFLIEDAAPQVILTQRSLVATLPLATAQPASQSGPAQSGPAQSGPAQSGPAQSGLPSPAAIAPAILCLDTQSQDWAQYPTTAPTTAVQPHHLAYLIYTSGSTGKPKGVMIEHRSLVHFTRAAQVAYGLTDRDRVLQFASISFDIAVEEIFCTLTIGATLLLRTPEMILVPRLLQGCREQGITVLDLPTAYWHLLVAELVEAEMGSLPADLRLIIFGGEKVSPKRLQQWRSIPGNSVTLINSYGPTEATVVALAHPLPPGEPSPPLVLEGAVETAVEDPDDTIGRPLPNVTIHLLDGDRQPVAAGSAGEIYIGGPGIARGYLNRPDLTAERFIPDPFDASGQGRLYATGDLARYRQDGNLEFLGRSDFQVKIRGFRVELSEVEAVLGQHPLVGQAVVILRTDHPDRPQLVAYLLPKAGQSTDLLNSLASRRNLRQFLRERLPDYMVPDLLVVLESLPLTPNAKVDRQALPQPTPEHGEDRKTRYVSPQNALEEQLAQLWQGQLGQVEPVGRDDNFFALGGTSLQAVQLASRIEKILGRPIPLSSLFQCPTLGDLAEALTAQASPTPSSGVVTIQSQGDRPPLFFVNSISYAKLLGQDYGPDYPLYGLNIFGLTEELLAASRDTSRDTSRDLAEGGSSPATSAVSDAQEEVSVGVSLATIAHRLIQDLRSVQPEGPYYLCGYCDDAYLAYEIAQQLQQQWQTVALLAFIDGIWDMEPPSPLPPLSRPSWSYLLEKVRHRIRITRYFAGLRYQRFIGQIRGYFGHQQTELDRDLILLNAYRAAIANYVPDPYPGSIRLITCSEWRIREVPTLSRLAQGGLQLKEVEGLHHNLFIRPQVHGLVDQIQDAIDGAAGLQPEALQASAEASVV